MPTSKKELLRTLLRKGYSNPEIVIDDQAKPGSERRRIVARVREIEARQEELRGEIAEINRQPHDVALLESAEFVCAVDAQEPSLSQLREAVVVSRQYCDLCDEQRSLERELGNIEWRAYRCKYNAMGNGSVLARSDTLTELAEEVAALPRKEDCRDLQLWETLKTITKSA